MSQQRFQQALQLFEQAYALDPELHAARLNQGIALLNLQRYEPARLVLTEVLKRQPQDARAWYNLGLLYKAQGQAADALDAFQHAAQLAPKDADAQYFVGSMASQLRREPDAIAGFQRALDLNPFHASAEFGLARSYQRLGKDEEARQHLARFQHLSQTKLGAPITLAYGDQGALSIAEQVHGQEHVPPRAIQVSFTDATAASGLPTRALTNSSNRMQGACFFDYDHDGYPDLFLTKTSGIGRGTLFHNEKGKFVDVTKDSGLDKIIPSYSCAAADYDNDGFVDLAIQTGSELRLFHNEKNGTFKDVTSTAGISSGSSNAPRWFDYDHDGDVDLFVGPRMWRNNGNGTFTEVTSETALAVSETAISAIPTDFNNDRAIDLLVSAHNLQPILFTNPREGKWARADVWPSSMPKDAQGIAVLDFDKDGWMDVAFTNLASPGISLWRNLKGRKFEQVALPDLHWTGGFGIVAFDYDNDGFIDLAAVGKTADGHIELRILRNLGDRFEDVSHDVGADKLQLRGAFAGLYAADYDRDGDVDLLISQADGSVVLLRNDGGNQNNWVRISLQGLNDNKSAIGTKVEVFAGDLWQKFELTGAAYMGQNSLDITAGLGRHPQADVIRLLWPTGVVQDEVEIAARKLAAITEIDRRGSSCPVLFAWDGARYRFVADMIGAGVIGHWIAPGVRNVADSTEYLKLEGFQPQLRHGYLSFRLMEPMEEVVYLDQVRLLAIDHPAEAEVFPNEYFASNPPFPEFKVIVSRGAQPVRAWDDRGREVTDVLRSRDHRYLADFALLSFKGFARQHSLELDLGAPYSGGALRLLLAGYIEYFTATSMYAAHQAGLEPMAPHVEALDASGKWVRVLDDMGFPAGLPRTITVDLTGKLPAGARRLRLTTNLQIYWDQILVDRTGNGISTRITELPLASAALRFHGYPRAIEHGTPGDLTYVYEDVSRTGPYARAAGAYTRLGDVHELLTAVDDRFVVFGPGEEVALDFDPAALPPLSPGWKRDYFFFADGFEKDMDFYAANPVTVEPLPFHAMEVYPPSPDVGYPGDPEHRRYRLEFNTRFDSGAPPPSYRFQYGASVRPAGRSH